MSSLKQSFKSVAKNFVEKTFSEFAVQFSFESLTMTPDGQGGFSESWSNFSTVSGFVEPQPGGEQFIDGQVKFPQSFTFAFESIAGLDEKMRINYNSEFYNIESISPVMDSDVWTEIVATKSVRP